MYDVRVMRMALTSTTQNTTENSVNLHAQETTASQPIVFKLLMVWFRPAKPLTMPKSFSWVNYNSRGHCFTTSALSSLTSLQHFFIYPCSFLVLRTLAGCILICSLFVMEVSFFTHSFLMYAVFLESQLGHKTRPWCKFCTGLKIFPIDSIGKFLSNEFHVPMILIVNKWLFENSAEERTKQVGTLRLNRLYAVTKKNKA
jgi:hypothetical protein